MAQQQATKPNAHLTFADDTAFRQLSWSWSRSVDKKDWKLLLDICAPEVRNYYKQLDPSLPNDIVPRKEFVDTWSSQSLVGDERLHTQHLLGNVTFEFHGHNHDHASGLWQILATHRRKLNTGQIAVYVASGYVKHFYDKIEGEWRFGGAEPQPPLTEEGKMEFVFGNFPRGDAKATALVA